MMLFGLFRMRSVLLVCETVVNGIYHEQMFREHLAMDGKLTLVLIYYGRKYMRTHQCTGVMLGYTNICGNPDKK